MGIITINQPVLLVHITTVAFSGMKLFLDVIQQQTNNSACHLLTCWFLLNYLFDPEDGGDMFIRNVGCNSTDYTASYPR
jgi:hypothetical protein